MTDPVPTPPLLRWVLLCAWAALWVQGCAITAPATAWRPAEIDVEGMQRLCVLEFSGENGQAVTAALTTRLWENEFYALVDPADLTPIRVASASGVQAAVRHTDYFESARDHSVDGLIIGDVIEYRCDDQVLTSSNVHVATDRASNENRGLEHSGVDVGVSQQETIHREATVSIAFRLVEVETGAVRATRKTTHHFQGDLEPGLASLPTKGEVLDELVQECVNEFVTMLAPHEVAVRLPLARSSLFQRGQALVSKGNDFAKRGRWEEATATWKQALDVNTSNDAALYNLAVAHSVQNEFTLAEEYAIQAMNLKHRELYADGLDQIRRRATDHEQMRQQRQHVEARPLAVSPRPLSLSQR